MTVLDRVARTAFWLLTPVVVWAASFFGAWVGATLTQSEIRVLGLGGVLGGGLGFAVWLFVLRSVEIRYRNGSASRLTDAHPSDQADPRHEPIE